MEPAQKEKTPLELPKPEEKLLRPPSFFEKYAWIKPFSIIAILIATIILSSYLLRTNNQTPDTISITPSPTAITSPKLSCRPRPACLDAEFPRCMIPETPDMCPKTTPSQPNTEKITCGTIRGLRCPNGYQCQLDGNYPDAAGVCVKNDSRITPGQVFCTQDAKQCPDGSWVGRTGPNCEFICPKPKNGSALENACREKGGTWLDKYQECESIPSDKGLDQAACTALGGTFNGCDSACRHNNNPQQGCILVCVKTCKFN